MGNFSENFKFMNRHRQADFTNEPTLAYYKEVLIKLIEKKFGVLPEKLVSDNTKDNLDEN